MVMLWAIHSITCRAKIGKTCVVPREEATSLFWTLPSFFFLLLLELLQFQPVSFFVDLIFYVAFVFYSKVCVCWGGGGVQKNLD